MRRALNLILVLLFLLSISYINIEPAKANDGVWISLGSNYLYSEVRTIAIDKADANIIYIGTWEEGIFKTTNGGESWKPINNGLTDTYIHSIKIDPQNANIIYVGTGNGVYKSTDAGESWNEVGSLGVEVLSLAIDPTNTKIIYAGIYNEGAIEGVFKSLDGGENWENIGLKEETIFSIVIKPDNSQIIYAGTWYGIFKSTDHGYSWNKIGLNGKKVNVLKIEPQNANIIYVGTGNGVYKSTDAGESWNEVGSLGVEVLSLAIDPINTKIIYAGTDTVGMSKSIDRGEKWERLRILANEIPSIEVDNNGTIYVGTELGVSKSQDGGKTFKTISNPKGIEALAIDPIVKNTIYAATLDGIYKSNDEATSWKRIGLDGVPSFSIVIDPKNPKVIYVGTLGEGIYKSIDGGMSWENKSQGITDPYEEPSVLAIAINPDNTEIIYAGTWNGVFRSNDSGNSWESVGPHQESELRVFSIQIDPSNDEVLYVGTWDGIFKSTNGGLLWENIGLKDMFVSSLIISPKNPQIIYAGTYSYGILKSLDGGKSWSNTAFSKPEYYKYYNIFSLAIYPDDPNTVFAVGLFYVPSPIPSIAIKIPVYFKSSNGGLSWEEQDLPNTIPYVQSILLDDQSNIAYLGTPIGVFKSDLNTGKGNFTSFGFPNNYVGALLVVKETLYAGSTDGNIGKSEDGGNLWRFTARYSASIHFLTADPRNPLILYAGTSIGILKSKDGGDSWDKERTTLENVYCIAIDSENSNTIYVGTGDGVLKSDDGGETWQRIGIEGENVFSITIDSKNTSILYAGSSKGIFKSVDGGKSWTLKKTTDENIYAVTLKDSNIIYVGTGDGVLKSDDGGETWKFCGIEGANVFCMLIDPYGNVYAGTDSGVFLSENSGCNWNAINNGLTNFYINTIAIDNKGNIYVGTDGGGIFKFVSEHSIEAKAGDGGFISPTGSVIVNSGTDQTFTITPNTGYHIKDVKVDGKSVGAVSTYTFTNVTDNHTIEATFEPITYLISVSSGPGGSISPSGTITVNSGESKTFTVTPYSGYKISDVKVDGVSKGAISSYTFANVTSNNTIEATFEKEITETVIILQIGSTTFTVNGVSNTLDSPPVIKNNRTLLPIRAVIESLGGTVGWDATERKVTVTLGSKTIELWIGKNIAKVNGTDTPIDSTNSKVVPEIINSRTMLPLRFVTENLGCDVQWDGGTQTITITYQG